MFASTQLIALVTALAVTIGAAPTPRDVTTGTKTGQGTFFTPGLGSCGATSTSSDKIVAVSTEVFSGFPGAGANPNTNPICGKTVTASSGGKSVTATVVDSCPGCAANDLDFSPAAFNELADPAAGRIPITWTFN